MDLPIDHFRLLGVSPSADAQGVLRTLQSRLDRVPHGGFTPETLQARADLLRASADLLCDHDRRAAYEAELTGLADTDGSLQPALEIATTRQVGGLLLLMEGGQPHDAFELASRCLQLPQAPTLGSGRETDLTLLAGLSCLEAARELEEQRRFEAAARTLRQGLQLLQRLGRQPELRETMNARLDRLTPYRVLDLLSRDLAAGAERREGLALLEQLVQRRGGLEGDGDPHFPPQDFQTFFHQIRSFLTVQEQVDLFSRWAASGSEAADFLATIALTASGFAQRKPERIADARNRLQRSGREGVEPLLANLHLLLGEADTARACFDSGASQDLKAWAAGKSDDPLGQLCAYCSDWLVRDVLPGYRDLEAEPDLVAYFSDRDVVAYVEREDQRRGRAYLSAPAPAAPAAAAPPPFPSFETPGFPAAEFFSPATSAPGGFPPLPPTGPATDPDDDGEPDDDVPLRWPVPPRPWLLAGGAAVLLLAGAWVVRQRQSAPPPPPPPAPLPAPAAKPPAAAPAPSPGPAIGQSLTPLTSPRPDAAQVRRLLENWLTIKGDVLAGGPMPQGLDRIARKGPVDLLASERRSDAARGQTQRLDVRISDLTLSESGPRRIVAVARLRYSDRRLDANGTVVETTPPMELRNGYVFGRDGDSWRLAATQSLN
ncbi:ARC6/PARC6 family protein [Cyanobium gracile UHCC 0139]|uniref:ARC6/PARC6 family protein n=1 Tax=Cyanobium gracile UHCC 0139 TaxID=3110308 RepID=A0ABU5RV28_9CYAN|nr:ARC6/PARC6 family protein [Cyanobium gracile]MEA5391649.1 ARC6/PARC6 family protein [Cyanobium gracile UHCC 0139]